MPDLDKVLFAGNENISSAEWATITTPDMSGNSVAEFLEGNGWDGNAAGIVGLQLSADNTRPTAACFALAGRWSDRPNRIQAQKVFMEAPADWMLEINLPDMSKFHFGDGCMASDYWEVTHWSATSTRWPMARRRRWTTRTWARRG